ncbi:hypothetical protein RGU70_15560 [Herbaspirillum sp. RTI4]|uniref:hypothetical protein n=1 Tax=Herbaspirillum sp. RTI4 TaxID=3048640 RepID=UPI002AB47D46|nr:hypothetical protein [Herbaspirillum sp. RTI4]MDY7579731.1 hypothetical protein [Herbaspirillum sp. RTI4]MEA9982705.1 hypothetical protein [Herbaspirillum sp. RTI4]
MTAHYSDRTPLKRPRWRSATVSTITAVAGALLVCLTLVSCTPTSSVPRYTDLSVIGFNYTPYNLFRFKITDQYGNTLNGGNDLMPGTSDIGNNCCHTLQGTEFNIEYQLYDVDAALKQNEAEEPMTTVIQHATVSLPATNISEIDKLLGRNVFGVFFYPDNFVQFKFNKHIVDAPRIVYGAIYSALDMRYHDKINPEQENDATIFRDTTQIAAAGWSKYRLLREDDLEQYVYFGMLFNPRFDEHPVMRRLLEDSRDKPGYFAENSKDLPPNLLAALKSDSFRHLEPQAPLDIPPASQAVTP